jgi:drug/metabolite transporter (DMT)-like permease
VFTVCTAVITCWRPQAVKDVATTPTLWVLMVAAGTTNAAFNWAVAIGDVVRVVLLFYLMPLWTVLLARVLLHEKLTLRAAAQVALALGGAAIVLWPAPDAAASPLWQQRLPLPRDLAEWLGVLGGLTFALNNVMLRREARRSHASRGWAMFAGGVLMAGGSSVVLTLQGSVPAPPAPHAGWLVLALGMALVFLFSNMALQFGAARLPAHVTAVVMLSEVVFASASAAALGGGQLTPAAWAGGGLILLAALLAALPAAARPGASA